MSILFPSICVYLACYIICCNGVCTSCTHLTFVKKTSLLPIKKKKKTEEGIIWLFNIWESEK
uniref:Uncharacterized protein n=1 Tax=Nelumbo nucifera TaxID=4432 RepID=A0A823A271_NELNU|nr:TPA_asm: hypothetical protein HUJ06_018993 [Nelumbo nucifera]